MTRLVRESITELLCRVAAYDALTRPAATDTEVRTILSEEMVTNVCIRSPTVVLVRLADIIAHWKPSLQNAKRRQRFRYRRFGYFFFAAFLSARKIAHANGPFSASPEVE